MELTESTCVAVVVAAAALVLAVMYCVRKQRRTREHHQKPLPSGCTPQRIAIIGVSGCGKSTLGQHMAQRLGRNFIELDDIWYTPGVWTCREEFERQCHLQRFTGLNRWISAGTLYLTLNTPLWKQADTIIWLDRGFCCSFYRYCRRGIACLRSGSKRYRHTRHFLSRLFSRPLNYYRRLPEYKSLFSVFSEAWPEKRFIRVQTQEMVDELLSQLSP